ncbi:MAG: sensor histidine kinase [Granulosicoccus sp.]
MNSLERSLQLGLLACLVVLLFFFWWTVTLSSRLLTESFVFMQLEREADNIVSQLSVAREGADIDGMARERPHLHGARLDLRYAEPASGHYYLLAFSGGDAVVSRSAWEQHFDIPQLVAGQSRRLRLYTRRGAPVLSWAGGYRMDGWPFTIAVLRDITPIVQRLQVFQWFAGAVALLLLLALLAVQRLAIQKALQQLNEIRRDMLRMEEGRVVSLSDDVPVELRPLVREFNQLVQRFDHRLRQSRNAVGNLAHSLKGPLNLLLRATEESTMETADKALVEQHTEHIRLLLESELKRARLAGRTSIGTRVDIAAELPAMIGLLKQVYSEKAIEIRVRIPADIKLQQDRQDMLELVGNLLDNASKWCRSTVMITIGRRDGVVIDVDDDGPGCSPEVISSLTDRGVRIDESVSGHGLGLSIVKDIADSYEGQVTLQPSTALGGLNVSVFLPDRPDPVSA